MDSSLFDPREQHSSVEARITYGLERVAEVFRVLLWRETRDSGLSPIQVQVLVFLLFQPAQKRRVSYLAREFNMTKATVSEVVKTLVRKKLVQKEADENDTRSSVLHLTPAGESSALKSSRFAAPLRQPLRELGPKQQEELLSGMVELLKQMEKMGIISTLRMCPNCRFFEQPGKGEFHCGVLKKALAAIDLHTDCPDHEAFKLKE